MDATQIVEVIVSKTADPENLLYTVLVTDLDDPTKSGWYVDASRSDADVADAVAELLNANGMSV